ncbi:MAG: phytanoyl-CoA dioxygenase family protein [Lentisphaerae bacterium]|nr:phytanoyl-CoA dioxygenase family protein [Lentisphaerota bacterium]
MPLTDANVQQFKTEGYTLVPDFWSPREVDAMRAELATLVRNGKLRNVKTEGDGKTHSQTQQNLQICPIWHTSPFFRAVGFVPKVVDAVTRLIGSPAIQQLDQIFLKPARTGAPTNWHQDNAYFKIPDPLMGTAVWSALHDATVENGTMRLIPGSFREVYEHKRDPESDHHIRCWPPEERAVYAKLPAGGAAFFCYGTAHATGTNGTDQDRAGLALHYLRADYASAELLAEDRNCRPYVTGPKATGGLKEYGITVAGTWEQEVARVLAGRPA